jgi:hypothetical protein
MRVGGRRWRKPSDPQGEHGDSAGRDRESSSDVAIVGGSG